MPYPERKNNMSYIRFLVRKKSKGSATFSRTEKQNNKTSQSRIPYAAKISFRNEGKSRQVSKNKRIWCQKSYAERMVTENYINRMETMK